MGGLAPIHYQIHLEPDLKRFRFEGRTEILIQADEPTTEVALNSLDLAVRRCRFERNDEFLECPFRVDPKKEELRISLPDETTGRFRVGIDYTGEINNRMAGFYRSKAVVGGREKTIAVTQFEESDARRAFPCFDHPLRKATFDVEMVVDDGLTALSNCPVKEEAPYDEGRRLIRFEQTPRMSTYLLFFGIGEFEFIEDPGDVLIRVAATPGAAGQGRFGLAFARKTLAFSEDYYGIRYPLPKLDLIAVADFAFGAMENWGAITFRENLLFHDPDITSRAGEEGICVVIAHEIAHQWFGNLVTPSDWKYLWLNESFATYFGYGVVDSYYPEWGLWEQFLIGQTDTAFGRDSLVETFPIEIPGGEHVVINAGTAPIIYNKGASILRQVEGYVGKEAFRNGLRYYLDKHAYACAASHDLWDAFEAVSDKPVRRMMKSWIEQPGFPMVNARREGGALIVSQERFTYLPHEKTDQEWMIPLAVLVFYSDGRSKTLTTLLEGAEAVMDMGRDAIACKVNAGQSGFYRVRYGERANLEELGRRAAEGTLSPEDRWGLESDLYALVKKGDIPLEDYLAFLSHYLKEEAFLPLMSISGNLFHAFLVGETTVKERVASLGRSIFEGVLDTIGYEPNPEEGHTTSILRDRIIWHAVLYGSGEALEFGAERFHALMRGEKIHPDIMKSAMQCGAFQGDPGTFEWFDGRLRSSESEHERTNILVALGCFKEQGLLEQARRYVLSRVPERNKFVLIGAMAANPHAVPHMWEWYVSSHKTLEELHPIHYERVLAAVVPVGGIGREEAVGGFFREHMDRTGKAKDVIKLSLERLEINARMRKSTRCPC
jgi:aminopeptidase N